ncbi:hypothetical protein GCM10022223_08870 [Kineosporia mesophila]|uniref:OmpR/PhoB-type domain-containing protein n=1 Tax=Kineosporia mesophila TaxID=566012 RepID=A0ABP6Z2C7_9ACTN
MEDLVHAVAPDVVTSVEIELREPARTGRGASPSTNGTALNGTALNGTRRWAAPAADDTDGLSPATNRTPALAPVPASTSSSSTEPREPGEPFDVDTTRRTLELDGSPVELTRREFDLLAFLERHRGQALGRDELMRAVWHTGYISGDRTIDVHVRRLRVKLGRHADRLVTLRGYGYRLD